LVEIGIAVIGGGVANAGDLLFTPLRKSLRDYATLSFVQGLTVTPALMGTDAGLVGAAAAASLGIRGGGEGSGGARGRARAGGAGEAGGAGKLAGSEELPCRAGRPSRWAAPAGASALQAAGAGGESAGQSSAAAKDCWTTTTRKWSVARSITTSAGVPSSRRA